jgi:3-oxoacyl-[acyl-carrier protein] reductase
MMVKPLSDRFALVTGGTRGIGAAIAARLLADGARVMVTGTKPDSPVPEGCTYQAVDFEDRLATAAFVAQVAEMAVDILINNAGINKISPFAEIEPADFDRIQQVNLRVPFLLCQAVLPGMKSRGWGRIVNISSIFGKVSREYRASYSASKFALDGMTAALAAEVAAAGILVNCVAPGFIDTDMTRTILGEAGIADLVARIPMKRLGSPEEIATFVAWLAGPENTYLSGQNIAVDGGFTRV